MPKVIFKHFHPFWLILLGLTYIRGDKIDDTLALLKQGDKTILTKSFNEAVLVFGAAGTGKTILTKFISDFDEEYVSKNIQTGNGPNFIIKHVSELESNSDNYLASDNTFTELLEDEITNVAYYNCPTFTFSNDFKYEIASNYFIYKALKSVNSVKIIFVLDDLNKINELIQYASKFIQMKFKDSIALILTKVSNDNYKAEVIAKLKSILSTTTSKNDRKIINALMRKIGIFKRPMKEGKLSEIPDMVQNKNDLKNLISNMNYAKINLNNFHFSFLYEKWNVQINEILDRINLLKSKEVNRKVEEYFTNEETRFSDFQQFRIQISEKLQRVHEIVTSLKEMSDPFDVEKQVIKYLYEIIVEIPKELSLYSDISDFLTLTNVQQLTVKSNEWITQLQSTIEYLNNLKTVFNVYGAILEKTKTSWTANRIFVYTKDTKKTLTDKIRNGEKIKGSDLNTFNTKCRLFPETDSDFVKFQNIDLNDIELQILYEIFEEASYLKKTVICTDDELILTGNYLTMSEAVSTTCASNNISINALNTFVYDLSDHSIDQDKSKISLIAPNWKVPNFSKLKIGQPRSDTRREDYGGAVLVIGGQFENGNSLHINSAGGELDIFGPLYNSSTDSERPCRLESGIELLNFEETKKFCKENVIDMKHGPDAYMFPNRGHVFIRYKDALINNLQNRYQRTESFKFLSAVNKIDNIYRFFRIPDYVEELKTLEKHYQNFKNKEFLKPLYENMLYWIEYNINNMKHTSAAEFVDYKILFRYLYSVTIAKIIAINSNSHNTLVVDIDKYFDYILDNIRLLRENNIQEAVDNAKAKYQKQLDQKIKEGENFIENHITPRIKQVQGYIISLTETQLIKEIDEVTLTVEKQMEEIKDKMWQVAIAGILGFVGTVLTIFGGPVGVAFGTLMNMGSAVVSSLNVGDQSTKMHQVPQDLQYKLASVNKFVGDYEKEREEVYSATITYLEGAKVHDKSVEDAYNDALKITAINPDDRLKLTHAMLDDHVKKLKKIDPVHPSIKNFKEAKAFANVAEIGTKAFLQVKDDVAKIDAFSDLLEEKKEELENLKKLRSTVSENLVPLLKNISKDLNEKILGLRIESRISLDVQKWKIKEALTDLRIQLQTLTNGFQVQAEILNYVAKLGEGVEVVIAIFDKIQMYEEQKKFSDYIFDITHPKIDFKEVIQDVKLVEAKESLDIMLTRNVLIQNYQNAINGLKQHLFPFAEFFFTKNDVKVTMNDTDSMEQTITKVGEHLQKLQRNMKKFKSTMQNDNQYILSYKFEEYHTYHTFFTWRKDEFSPIIERLMNGEQVVLKADITSSTKNAVKFNVIELLFKSTNKDVQDLINKYLIDFEIFMTHMGDSYYKCDDKIFVIPSENVTIRYGFAKTDDGRLRTKNLVSEILRDSYFMLSPYAMWTVQLKSNSPDGFSKLGKLFNSVSLQLAGEGQYVAEEAHVCQTDLESYYELDSTYHMRKYNLLE